MNLRIDSKPVATGFFLLLIVLYIQLGWNARDKILQGNSDFIIYYTAIQMVKEGQGSHLYDLSLASAHQQKILDSLQSPSNLSEPFRAGLLFFVNPPVALLWFLPLTELSYLNALLVWDFFSLLCFCAGVTILLTAERRRTVAEAGFIALACLVFPPVFVTLLQGQVSSLLFLAATLAYRSLKHNNERQAGLWFCVLLTKFQLLLPFLALFLWRRQWRILSGFLLGGVVALLVSWSVVGSSGIVGYARLVVEMSGWVNQMGMTPRSMHCLRGQFNAWWYPDNAVLAAIVTGVCSFVFVVLLIRAWRSDSGASFDLRYSLLVVVSILISPHLYVHDLSLLLIPGLLLYEFSARNTATQCPLPKTRHASDADKGRKTSLRTENLDGSIVKGAVAYLPVALFMTAYPLPWLTMIVSSLVPIQLSVWVLMLWAVVLAAMARSFERASELK